MLEIPESVIIARQLNETVLGKTICNVVANYSPHKFAFYHGDPAYYKTLLSGQVIGESVGIGAMIEIFAGNRRIVISDGAILRYHDDSVKAPSKHQLLLELNDGSILVCSIQMYSAVLAFKEGTYDNKYYLIAKEKPSPLTVVKGKFYLEQICQEISERYVGSEGNRSATSFFKDRIASLGWKNEIQELKVIDWKDGGATLKVGKQHFKALVSPYSLGCSAKRLSWSYRRHPMASG